MKKLLLAILFALILSAPARAADDQKIDSHPCGVPSEAWKFCQQDSDCGVGIDECRYPDAFNKQFLGAARHYADCMAPMVNCAPQSDVNPPTGVPVCKEEKCVRADTQIHTATTCRAAIAALEDFLTSQPHSCVSNEECDGYFFRAESCTPAVVLPKRIVTASFTAELLQNQEMARDACADQWKERPACSPMPFLAVCENRACIDKFPR